MKKRIWIVFILTFLIICISFIPKHGQSESQDYQVIPDEAIRLRILANSDSDPDQQVKHLVRDAVSDQITDWVQHISDIDEARSLIQTRIPDIRKTIHKVLKAENEQDSFEVSYGSNITFPVKIYDSIIYPAGEYEAILITIGEGNGSNWWCVLFPPLCFLDFSNGTQVANSGEDSSQFPEKEEEKEDSVEIKFFLFEWLGWS